MRIWQRSLAARFILLLLLALVLSQGAGFIISWDERGQALRSAAKSEFFSRTASLTLLLESTPSTLHNDILKVSGTNYSRFWISPSPPQDVPSWWSDARTQLVKPLPNRTTELDDAENDAPAQFISTPPKTIKKESAWTDLPYTSGSFPRPARYLSLETMNGSGLTIQLSNDQWLNAVYAKPMRNSPLTLQSLFSLLITAIALSVIAIIVTRSITRPMRHLAAAAELLGRGESVPNLPESGPDDIRQMVEAFNRMQARIQKFNDDRTLMLAAIGHDLRTPITSLRLRAEFVTDPDIQEKMLGAIEEIRSMTEAAIAYAREEATVEATRATDLSALVESLCDDLAELGMRVSYIEGSKIIYRCRPDALRRALRNVIENAVRYGEQARVNIHHTVEGIDIMVEDDGPGIPDNAQERVFAPFFRLEDSRSRDTGGIGLGLSIARAIVRHHGGDVSLNNLEVGLRVRISLPVTR
ncbi:two-component sensor histidine kinase [Pseudomonas fluorescens]|uniref:histidine kinase n=2 Tax=Pseudomonas fluorescens TaxID=294 RepID=A0A1T2Z9P7_PSEFL|nr:two-component sensor histidine kinase [Pseudomonas fluorescens]